MQTRITLVAAVLALLPASVFGEIWHFNGNLGTQSASPPATLAASPVDPLGTMTLKFNDYLNNTPMLTLFFEAQTSSGFRYPTARVGEGGAYQFTKLSGTGTIGDKFLNGRLDGFCMDLEHPLFTGTMTYSINPISPSPNGAPMRLELFRELWGRYYSAIFTGSLADQRNKAEAFSLAIWELRYETGSQLNVTSGAGFNTPNYTWRNMPLISGIANTWLNSLDGTGKKWDIWELDPISPGGVHVFQDIMVGMEPLNPVPEPAIFIHLVALGLTLSLGRVWLRRRVAAGK
jgi:hypothetical protein